MKRLLIALIALTAALAARAVVPEVSLVTISPGSEIYELEGHTALRLRWPGQADLAVHYGLFDFNSPGFVYRFVKGETDYMVGVFPWQLFEDNYRRQGRRMVARRLALDSVATSRLLALLEDNMLPENVIYRYNYVRDNCATRPLRLIERAIGDSIILRPTLFDSESSRPVTFRNIMRRYHRNYPWYQFGIDLALGSGIDSPLSPREEAFAPVLLDSQLPAWLVADSLVVIDLPPDNAVASPTPWFLSPPAVCWAFFAISLLVCLRDWRRRRLTRWFTSAYFAILGLAGLLLSFLIFVSVHEATSPNWLYAWLNPLCLIPAIFIWLKNCKPLVYYYQFANFAVLFLLLIAWPLVPQSANPAFLSLVLADMLLAATYIGLNYKK